MSPDSEIGRVVAVDTAQVSIELNPDLRGMSRTTYEGTQEVGRINSYIVLPVGARRLVAVITRVVLVEDAEMKADRTMVALPAARRMMKAILIGTIDGRTFRQGVSVFPLLDNPVHLAQRADLDAIFGPTFQATKPDPKNPGYCIPIGESAIVKGRPIRIDPDAFFGKHAAIIGSTGSGKSCTIASLLQSIAEQPEIRRTTCVILDTNGEYRAAFQRETEEGTWADVGARPSLYVPSDVRNQDDRISIPYWFLNAEDFVRIFQASQGVQRPVLLEALRLARNDTDNVSSVVTLREELIRELNRIWSLSGKDDKTSRDVRDLAAGLARRIAADDVSTAWNQLESEWDVNQTEVTTALKEVVQVAKNHIDKGTFARPLPSRREKVDPRCNRPHKREADAYDYQPQRRWAFGGRSFVL